MSGCAVSLYASRSPRARTITVEILSRLLLFRIGFDKGGCGGGQQGEGLWSAPRRPRWTLACVADAPRVAMQVKAHRYWRHG